MSGVDPRAARFIAWLSPRTGTILIVSLVISVVTSLSLLRLEFDVGLVSMLPQGNARFSDYQRYVERFGTQDVVVALVRAPDRASARRFGAALAGALEGRPEIVAVRSGVDRIAFLRALADGALPRMLPVEVQGEVAARLRPEAVDATVTGIRRALAAPGAVGLSPFLSIDPLGLSGILGGALAGARPDRTLDPGSDVLASPDGTRLLLLIRPAEAGFDLAAGERLAAVLAEAEAEARAAVGGDGISVGYTGAFAHAREDSGLLQQDTILLTALGLVGVLSVFYVGYRNLRILPFVTYHLLLTTAVTLALGLVVSGSLNLLALAFATIFYGLGIDTAIHWYTRYLEEREHTDDLELALGRTMTGLFWPMVLSTATTATAFVAIGFSALAGVAQLGFLTALGLVLNIPATFVVVSALQLWFDRRGLLVRPQDRGVTPARWLARLAVVVARHRRTSLAMAAVVLVVALAGAWRTSLDTDLFHLRPSASQARVVEEEIQREFGFTDPHGSVLVETPAPVGEEQVEAVLRTVEGVTRRLEAERVSGTALSVTSPAVLLPSRATQEERLAAWAALPREAAAEHLENALAQAGFRLEAFVTATASLRRLPAPVDATQAALPGLEILLDRHLRRDTQGLSILVSFSPRDAEALEEVADRLAAVPRPDGVSVVVTGRPLMERALAHVARREMIGFLAAVLIGTLLLIGARERRVRPTIGLVAIPAASTVLVLGLSGAVGIPLNPVTVAILPLTIGLGMEGCLFLVERYRETGDVAEAVATGGRVMTITSATTITGFGVLALSRYPALSSLGLMAAMSLTICFFVTVLLLPALVSPSWLRREPRPDTGRGEAT